MTYTLTVSEGYVRLGIIIIPILVWLLWSVTIHRMVVGKGNSDWGAKICAAFCGVGATIATALLMVCLSVVGYGGF